jgi:hypothetical protein
VKRLSYNESRILLGVMLFLIGFAASACTDNQRSRAFGGTMEIKLPCDQVVFDVTWKGENLWYATQPPRPDWRPETKRFKEYSSYGVVEGEVLLIESRCSS